MTLKQFVESVWFKALARGLMILTPFLVAGFAGAWAFVTHGVSADLEVAQRKIADVAVTQTARASDSEAFQTEVRGAIKGLNSRLDNVDDKMFAVKVDIGVIKRLLQETHPAAMVLDPSDVPPELQATASWAKR
jgi:hypothetical protein